MGQHAVSALQAEDSDQRLPIRDCCGQVWRKEAGEPQRAEISTAHPIGFGYTPVNAAYRGADVGRRRTHYCGGRGGQASLRVGPDRRLHDRSRTAMPNQLPLSPARVWHMSSVK